MELTDIKELYRSREDYYGKEVTVGGWVRSNRDSKTFGFIVINDGTYFETLQVVYSDKLANFEEISKLNVGSAVVVKALSWRRPRRSSPLRCRRRKFWWKGCQAPIIRCRKSATALNI